MLERDEIGVAAAVLRRRGRRAVSPLALEAVWLVRPTTSATHHRQRRHSCIAASRGDRQGSARSAGNEAPAAARGPHGPLAVRRSWPEKREVAVSGGRGRAMGPRWAQRERLAEGRLRERAHVGLIHSLFPDCHPSVFVLNARALGPPAQGPLFQSFGPIFQLSLLSACTEHFVVR